MTNHWNDIQHADVILIMGSNAAENHPMSFKYVQIARERGGKLINVDPRFTRTSSLADLYAPIRPGTDIAFCNGIINYALQNDRIQKEYVKEYTSASFLVNPKYALNDGLFSGYDAAKRKYDNATWKYQMDGDVPKKDPTLKDPLCVYQLLKKHMERYTPEKVEEITGCPKESFLAVADLFTSTHKPDRVATIMYAMGTTQHTVGTQNIRCYSIMQLLMGNMGMAGGGINALRGESNVQGSTDHGLLFHLLPGYLDAPQVFKKGKEDANLAAYEKNYVPKNIGGEKSINWWKNKKMYLINTLKAWYGDAATKQNDFCYDWLPKAGKGTPHIVLFEDMLAGKHEGAIFMGTNPIVGGPNSNKEAKAIEKLKWLVCADLWETDTSIFWKRPGANPAAIQTEVFLLPMASSVEKEGSVSNSGRWAQWRYKAQNAPGAAISDLDFVDRLFKAVRALYQADVKAGKKVAFPDPILKATWNYCEEGEHEANPHLVAQEINGFNWVSNTERGDLLEDFTKMSDDGSTASGCWIYAGSYNEKGNNMARRSLSDPMGMENYPKWAWCWPMNRRIIYNRASVNMKGEPWNPKKPVIKWTGSKWVGDIPDGKGDAGAKLPFIMCNEGVARLFAYTLADGPLPEHYEPMESPVRNIMNSQKVNPASLILDSVKGEFGDPGQFPYIGTSYRVTEHWQAGAMTRNLPWLTELVPDMFCEISPTLAAQKGIKNGDKVKISSKRGAIDAYALVTDRLQPMKVQGREVEMVGMIWHFGHGTAKSGGVCNQLTPHIGCANTMIPEFKAFLVNIQKA